MYQTNSAPQSKNAVSINIKHSSYIHLMSNCQGMTSGEPCRTGVFGEPSGFEEKTRHKQVSNVKFLVNPLPCQKVVCTYV